MLGKLGCDPVTIEDDHSLGRRKNPFLINLWWNPPEGAYCEAGSLFLKKNPKGWPWWSFDGYRNFLAGLMIWYIMILWFAGSFFDSLCYPRDPITLSDDDWGVQSPPKRKVSRFHYHSQFRFHQDPLGLEFGISRKSGYSCVTSSKKTPGTFAETWPASR